MMKLDVTAIGELLIDFADRSKNDCGYPVMEANPGGAPGNFLAALSAYGAHTALLGKVGDDAFGRMLVETMRRAGIETRGIVSDPSVFTTLAFVTLSPEGERSFSFARKPGADTCLRWGEMDRTLIDDARVVHFGTLSLTDEPSRTATRRAVAYAKKRGKQITFDPNLRRPLWHTEDAAREQILWGISQADVVKISGEVMAPTTVAFRDKEKLDYYIDQAGGWGNNAKKGQTYIVYMNGTVAKASRKNKPMPGCEIIVPSKAKTNKLTVAEMVAIGSGTASIATMIATIANLIKN